MYIVLYFWTCLQHLYFECFQGSIVIYFQIFWEAEYRMEHRSPTRTKYSTDIKHSNTKYSTITCPTEQTNGETTIQTTTTSNEGMSCDWYNSQVRQQPPPMKVCRVIDTILKSDNNYLQWRYVVWLIQFSSQTTTTSNEGMSYDWYNSQVRQQPPPMKVCRVIDTILKSDNNHLQWRYVVWLMQFSSQTTTTSNEGMSCDWYNSQVRQQPPPMKVCRVIDTILKCKMCI